MAVEDWIKKYKFPPPRALEVGTQIHTSPEAFGKIMSVVKPRMAVGFHFFNDFDTVLAVESGIRTTYDGPLSLADDYLVWNVTKDDIKVREVVVNENAWPPAGVFESGSDGRLAERILESVSDGVMSVDCGLRITSFNSAAERLTGLARGAIG